MNEYTKGYTDALDDVEKAFEKAVVVRFDGNTMETFNDPKIFCEELKRLHQLRKE